MPTPLIHAAVSTAAAEFSGRPGLNHRAFWIFLFAANMADLDVIPGFFMGDLIMYHHHFTHSPAFALAVALALSLIPWNTPGKTDAPEPTALRRFTVLALICLSHPLLDLMTYDRYGTFQGHPSGIMLAWPLSLRRWDFWPIFSGLDISMDWRDWISPINLRLYAIEGTMGFALVAAAKYLKPPILWPRAKPEPIGES